MTKSNRVKVLRTTTVPGSLVNLIKGQLSFLNQYFDVVAVARGGEKLEFVAKREGVRTIAIPMERKVNPLTDLMGIFRLYKCFKREKPTIVHSMTPKAGLLSMIAAYFAGVPIRMHTFTGLVFPTETGFKQKVLILMDRILCKCATNIFPEGKGVKNDLIKFNITNKELKIIGNGNINGVDTSFFDPALISEEEKLNLKDLLNITEKDFIYVFVGRIVKDKGINELIEAFKIINYQNANTKLILVGGYDRGLDPILPETKQEIDKNHSILSVGYQNDIRPYLAISNVFTFPSYREGFPNVVLQAGAMGLACIVTDISGSNEIICNKVNGIIVKSRDASELHTQMEFAYKNPGLISEMSNKSRDIVKQNFEREFVWSQILGEYNSILSKHANSVKVK